MKPAQPYILFFKDIDKNDVSIVGGKGANLGEMVQADFPVPPGFAITIYAYDKFLKKNSLDVKIAEALKNLDVNDPAQLQEASKTIKEMIKRSEVPEEVIHEVFSSYKKLSGVLKNALVAVRSSATVEDLPGASFAGQQETFLNVKRESNLIEAVRSCWASLFTARSIFYRKQNKISETGVKISVIVQKMIQSEVSGVMFSIDPVTNDKDRIIIEAVWGLGEMIVQGDVIPDRYVVQKGTFEILSKEISDQSVMLTKVGGKNKKIAVKKKNIDKQKINDSEVIKLAKIANNLQKHYYFPQDIEWAKSKDDLYIVQTRPVTTLGMKTAKRMEIDGEKIEMTTAPILEGISASPGISTGVVKIIKNSKNISKVKAGDVLVSEMTSPDFVPAMKRASAIITDKGGQTSHAAIVSRELGIPCIVGTKRATKKLKDNQIITVDANKGMIYLGSKIKIERNSEKEKINTNKTATKLYVNLAEPQLAKKVSKLNIDGVGLLRAEFMIADIGIHPKEAIRLKKQGDFVKKLEMGIGKFCRTFSPRPVVYRATDFKTNEYSALKGGKKWEPKEPNPMLGYRGSFRYIADPEVFTLELRALKAVQKKYNNIRLMVPFVRSPRELSKIRKLVMAEGLFDNSNFKFWMMVEIPVNVISIDEFIDVGIDGVSVGTNDLTMLITGTDRDNDSVAQAFDERSDAVLWALKRTIRKCSKRGVTTSICGQAPSVYDDLVKKLVKWGITSISVNPDAINRVRGIIARTEKNIGK